MDPKEIEDIYPLTPMQRGMLFHLLYDAGTRAYFNQFVFTVDMPLAHDVLERAFAHVIQRHPLLRVSLHWEDIEKPLHVVARRVPTPIEIVDLRDLAAAPQERRVHELLQADRERGFELARAPLVRLTLLRLGDASYRIVLSYLHVLLEGRSAVQILADLFRCYEAFRTDEDAVLPKTRPFRDYVTWLGEQDLADAEAFWRRSLIGFGAPTSLIPGQAPARLGGASLRFDEAELELSSATSSALRTLATKQRLTLNTIIQGVWAIMLSRYSGHEDVLFGATVSGRSAPLEGIEAMVGVFINTLPVRVTVSPDGSVLDWLRKLQDDQVEARQHEHTPLPQILGWSEVGRGLPLFESNIVFENADVQGFGLPHANAPRLREVAQIDEGHYPLTLIVNPADAVGLLLAYDRDRFSRPEMERMLGHVARLLEDIATDPFQKVGRVRMLSDAESRDAIETWNATDEAVPAERLVHELFEMQVAKTPDAIAVVFDGKSMSYGELDRRSNQLANVLVTMGIGPDVCVGVCLDPSFEVIIALLAVLKAGGSYVPVDPTAPVERLWFMLTDANAQVILTEDRLAENLPVGRWRVVCFDVDEATIAGAPTTAPPRRARPENLAYVVYTSGSTGEPKGVAVEHRSVVNHNVVVSRRFGLTATDRMLQFTPINFDAAVEEIFPPLATGGAFVIRGDLVPPHEFGALIEREGLTVLSLPPAFLHEWVKDLDQRGAQVPRGLRLVLLGGEKILPESYALWRRLGGAHIPWINVYGPTEATVTSAMAIIEGERPLALPILPIGGPVGNARIYLLDRMLAPVPAGHPGELYIAGAGLARGYVGRADETAQKFLPDPFARQPGARMYRTGDLARRRSDGQLEFLGRADDQIKLRGHRIELGEIEKRLCEHPAVREAVVVLREDTPNEPRLAAYVLSDTPLGLELREFVKKTLPAYMVPASFRVLDAWPLTLNGKIDKKSLPAPDDAQVERAAEYVVPDGAVEELLAGIWADVLGLQRVGATDDFFDLGGHSLAAVQVLSRVRSALGVEVPLRTLFDAPNVASLATALQDIARGVVLPPIKPVPKDRPLPLSFAQERLWFLHELEPQDSSYHIPMLFRMRGTLDLDALAKAFEEIVRRHEVFRTTYAYEEGRPVQIVHPIDEVAVPVELVSLESLPQAEHEARASVLSRDFTARPFDLGAIPLLRILALRLAPQDHVLTIVVHHIAIDGWCEVMFMRELSILYDAFGAWQGSPLPAPRLQYGDFAVWQRENQPEEARKELIAYWKNKLTPIPAALDLPTDLPRPAVHTYRGEAFTSKIPAALSQRLRELSRKENSTLFMTLLAGLDTLLARYSGQDDILIVTDSANRDRAATEDIMGFFVNQLTLRADLSGNPSFRELLGRVREDALGAYTHQALDFEEVVRVVNPERLPGDHSPLFRVKFVLLPQLPGTVPDASGVAIEKLGLDTGKAQNDLFLILSDVDEEIEARLHYRTDLFVRPTIEKMWDHFIRLLEAFVADPDERIGSAAMLAPGEWAQVVVDWNATSEEVPADDLVHERFEAQVARTPDAPAVIFETTTLSYRELNARANQLARFLVGAGIGPEVRVGICLEPSLETIVSVFGVLKAGGAYVPVDPTAPAERLEVILTSARVTVLLTQDRLDVPSGPWQRVALDTEWRTKIAGEAPDNLPRRAVPDNLAYIVYTSGSTGEPKGVLIQHRSVVNHNVVVAKRFALSPSDRMLQFTPINFDAAGEEIFPPLASGAAIVVRGELVPTYELAPLIEREKLTVLSLPPAYLHEWVVELDRMGEQIPFGLRLVLLGGEKILPQSYLLWRNCGGDRVPWLNVYGPTEATVTSAMAEIFGEEALKLAVLPIGGPIGNAQIYLLGPLLEPVPVGHPGELYIAGAGLARGYEGRPDETAEKFLPDPFSKVPGARMYRTRDLARRRSDGQIEFVGRADDQVKLRGFRIELGEIENALRRHSLVTEAVVIVREDVPGDRRLAGYVVVDASAGGVLTGSELREMLKRSLPDYMVPSVFVLLSSLPLTPNGKIDKRALPVPEISATVDELVSPRTREELAIVQIWEELLDVRPIGVTQDFFELGGHSLLAVRMTARIKEVLDEELPLTTLFDRPTVEHLARQLVEQRTQGGTGAPRRRSLLVPIQVSGDRPPMFCVHPVGGTVFCYYMLANRLGPAQPFYGLQSIGGFDTDEEPHRTFEEMATAYLEAMRAVQPTGPYHIGGWSSGGQIALEIAQQLRARGEEVGLLALFDTVSSSLLTLDDGSPHRALLDEGDEDKMASAFMYLELGASPDEVRAMPTTSDERWTVVFDKAKSSPHLPAGYGELELRRHGRLLARSMQAGARYQERTYSGPITLFATRSTLQEFGNPTLGWSKVGRVDVEPVAGGHLSLMSSPHVEVLADRLTDVLAKVPS